MMVVEKREEDVLVGVCAVDFGCHFLAGEVGVGLNEGSGTCRLLGRLVGGAGRAER